MTMVSRYHPLLVALHWLIAAMILGLLCLGFFVLSNMPSSDPRKLQILQLHAAGGMTVLLLMIVRLVVRLRTTHPTPVAGPPVQHRLALAGHWSFYLVVFAMTVTGWLTGFQVSGSWAPGGPPLPDFMTIGTFRAHAILATLLCLLITGHVAFALWHQFGRKDGLFGRMAFGRRTV